MKRTLISVLAALVAIASVGAMAGCGNSSSGSKKSESSAASTADTSAAGSVVTDDDMKFTYNGTVVELNSDSQTALAALGEYQGEPEPVKSCVDDGMDMMYTYDGFNLCTHTKDGVDRVLNIVVKSDALPTSKGVKVGDDISAVTAAYGDYNRVGKTATYYYSTADGKKELRFTIVNDKVEEIEYFYNVV